MTLRPALRRTARALLVLAVLGTVWASLLPPADVPSTFGLSDKVMHVLGYALLGLLAVASGLRWMVAVGSVIALGLALELAQGVLGYRSFEWADLVADAAGALAGATAAVVLQRWAASRAAPRVG